MITYWHNPRCSKSRTGLDLLEQNGAQVEVRKYLEDAPSVGELRDVLSKLGIEPIDMMRTGEKRFKELGLSKSSPADELISAMAENPILIERPLAIAGDKAAIGRPPEELLSLL
ncbi:arsenate reductase (glutaredoxin) [Ruegeria profundi]|uniref:arsenate reductase (glutaredoxin) n=1 Tax=Ruegeria profundi TaxID=1685378 RepID=UPI001CD6F02E|nr:arsenate reductase (glutaredoxin) [Ruegeria profundi]MCA0927568.1 arsenate reductase (glutaredoxin) [Ruegeria profundi]